MCENTYRQVNTMLCWNCCNLAIMRLQVITMQRDKKEYKMESGGWKDFQTPPWQFVLPLVCKLHYFVDWRNLLRNFKSLVDFSLYLYNIPCPCNRECISAPQVPQFLVLHPLWNYDEVETCDQQLPGTYSCCCWYSADKLGLRGWSHKCLKVLQLNLSHLNWESH